jgi:hypothetical protein
VYQGPVLLVLARDALAERLRGIAEVFLREQIVDDDDLAGIGRIGRREAASLQQRNLHGLEEIFVDDLDEAVWRGFSGGKLVALDEVRSLRIVVRERHRADEAGRRYARQRAHRFERALIELRDRCVILVAVFGQVDAHAQHALRVEAGAGFLQVHEASDQQARAGEQRHCKRHLHDDEHAPRRARRAAAAAAAAAFLEHFVGALAPQSDNREEAEQHAGQQRQRQRERDDAAIEADGETVCCIIQTEQADQLYAPLRNDQSGDAAGQREHQALDQKLAREPAAPGAERGADRQLFLPGRDARQHEIGDVGAGDQQHERDYCLQQQQHRREFADQERVQVLRASSESGTLDEFLEAGSVGATGRSDAFDIRMRDRVELCSRARRASRRVSAGRPTRNIRGRVPHHSSASA